MSYPSFSQRDAATLLGELQVRLAVYPYVSAVALSQGRSPTSADIDALVSNAALARFMREHLPERCPPGSSNAALGALFRQAYSADALFPAFYFSYLSGLFPNFDTSS